MQDPKGRKWFWRHMVDNACLYEDGAPKRQLVIALASAACRWDEAALVGAREYLLSEQCGLGRALRKEVKILFKQAGI